MKRTLLTASILAVLIAGGSQASFVQSDMAVAHASESDRQEESKEGSAQVTSYTLPQDKNYGDYTKLFQITGIQSYSNNGGKYGNSTLDKAFDGDITTHWETGKPNSASHTNQVTVTFEEPEKVSSIVYAPRKNAGNKGYPNAFSIYGSKSAAGDDFELIAKGSASTTSSLVKIRFPETTCRRIRFVYDKAAQNWASAGEFQFFRADPVLEEVGQLFTNGLMNEFSEKYKDKTVLNTFLTELKAHPMAASYQHIIDSADKLMNEEPLESSEIFVMSQRGNEVEERNRAKISYALHAFDPTGIYIKPGETLRIYVDADSSGRMPEVVTGYSKFTKLKPGYNEFKLADDATGAQRIHLANRALPEHQAYAPRIRIEGGSHYPVYFYGKTDNETFMKELESYTKDVNNGTVPDFAEISSENILIATSATGAYKGLKNQLDKRGLYADYTLETYEKMYRSYVEYSGFDYDYNPDQPWNMRPRGKFILTVHAGGPYGWAQHGWTGYNGGNNRTESFWSSLVQANPIENGGWAVFHEIGHAYDNSLTVTHESTNNLYSLMMQDQYLSVNRMVKENRWNNHFTKYHNTKQYPKDQLFLGAITYQLEGIYGSHIYGDAQRIVRENKDKWTAGLTNKERMAVSISKVLGINVLPHYEYYGIPMSSKAKDLVSGYPVIDIKSYYANDKTFAKDKAAFTSPDAKPVIQTSGNGNVTLNLSIDEPDNALLVYEIYRDGEYLGVTYGDQFADTTASENTEHRYTAIAYDRFFNASVPSDPVVKNPSEPVIYKTGDIKIAVNKPFNPLDYVKAYDAGGKEITDTVTVAEDNVDISKKGVYTVTYKAADSRGNKTSLTANVTVTADSIYLSDLTPSAKSGYYKKNIDPSGNGTIRLKSGNQEVPYYNGIAAHANTTVTYKLDQDYEYFEAYIGLDDAVRTRKAASVTFEVYLDDEKVYDSGIIKADKEQTAVKIPINGAGTLKLVTTNASDGNSYDHAVWADARLTTENGLPKLTIEKDLAVKVGENADIIGNYTAKDLEDGDLTAQVEVSGEVNFNQAGKYLITYTITDSDGNTVSAQRTISVVDLQDFTYVSDYDWVSASAGWGTVKKDKAPSGNSIRLSDPSGSVVTFEKGLGAHANSKIIYDLTNIDAAYFSAYVGVDRAMYNSVGSVGFEVWLDGVNVYKSDVIRAKDPMQYVEINLAGAKELKLITNNGGNGNGSDHSVWGDAKFHYANGERRNKSELQTLYNEVIHTDTTLITLDSVQIIQDLKTKLQEALSENDMTQDEINSLVLEGTEAFSKVEISLQKQKLGELLDEAYSGVYDHYKDIPAWEGFETVRSVYRDHFTSETTFTEKQYEFMTIYLQDWFERLEIESQLQSS